MTGFTTSPPSRPSRALSSWLKVALLSAATVGVQAEPPSGGMAARVREALVLADTQPQHAAQMLLEAPPNWSGSDLRRLEVEILTAEGDAGLAHVLALGDTMAQWLGGLADAKRTIPPGAIGVIRTLPGNLAAEFSTTKPPLKSLYLATAEQTGGMAKKRRAVHDALCAAMLRHLETADAGFTALAALSTAESRDSAPLVTMAEDILKQRAAPENKERIAKLPRARQPGDETSALNTPAGFLMHEAVRSGKPQRWTDTWRPLAQAGFDDAELRDIEAQARIWFCQPGEFEAAALQSLPAAPAKSTPRADDSIRAVQTRTAFSSAMEAWRARDLSAPLGELIPAVATQLGSRMELDSLAIYVTRMSTQGHAASFASLSGKLRIIWVGGTESQRRSALMAFDQATGKDSATNTITLWSRWLQMLTREPQTTSLALKLLADDKATARSRLMRDVMQSAAAESVAGRHAPLRALLTAAGCFRPTKDLPRASLDGTDVSSGVAVMLESLNRSLPDTARASLLIILRAERASPGRDLIMASLSGPDAERTMADFFKGRAAEQTALSPGQRGFLACLIAPHDEGLRKLAAEDSALADAMHPFTDKEMLTLESSVDAAAHGSGQGDDPDHRRLRSDTIRWLEKLATAHPANDDELKSAIKTSLAALRAVSQDVALPKNWLIDVAKKRRLLPIVLAAAETDGLMKTPQWSDDLTKALSSTGALSDPAAAVQILDQENFIGDAAKFRAVKKAPTATLLGSITQTLAKPELGDSRESVLAFLKGGPQSFGRDLVAALLAKDRNAGLREFLQLRANELSQLTPASADELRSIAAPALRNETPQEWNVPALQAFTAPIFADEDKMTDALRKKIMVAKSQADVNSDESKLATDAKHAIANLLLRDKKAARELYEKTMSLMEDKMRREGSSLAGSNGWTLRSQFVETFTKEYPRLDTMAFACRLMQEDQSGDLIHTGWISPGGDWSKTLHREWIREGGDASPERAAERLLIRVQEEFGDVPEILLTIPFFDFIERLLTLENRERVITWAEKSGPQSSIAPLARLLAVAGRLHILARPDIETSTAPLPGSVSLTPEEQPLWNYYAMQMEDASLSPRVRIPLAQHLCYNYKQAVDPRIARTGMKLIAGEMAALHATHGYQISPIIIAACQRSPADDELRELAAALWSAWDERNSHNPENYKFGRGFNPCDVAILSMLQLAAHTGDDAHTDAIFKDFSSRLNHDYYTAVVLIEESQFKRAETFLAEHLKDIPISQGSHTKYRHHQPHDEEAVKKWRESCADPALELAGEVLVQNMEDPPQPMRDAEKIPAKGARLAELRPRIVALKDDEKHTPVLLARFIPGLKLKPSEPAKKDNEAKPENTAAQRAVTDLERKAKISRAIATAGSVADQAAAGDVQAVRAAHENLSSLASGSELRTALTQFTTLWANQMKKNWEAGKIEHAQELRAYLEWAVQNSASSYSGEHLGVWLSMLLTLHAAKDDMSELDQWRAQLSEAQREGIERQLKQAFNVTPVLKSYLVTSHDASRRAAIIGRVLNDPWRQAAKAPGNGWVQEVIFKQALLTPDEAMQQGGTIARAQTRSEDAAGAFGALAMRYGRWKDAVRFFALGAQLSGGRSQMSADLFLDQCTALIRGGQTPEARDLLKKTATLTDTFYTTRARASALNDIAGK